MKQERKIKAESSTGVKIEASAFPSYVRVDLTFPDGKKKSFFEGMRVGYLTRRDLAYWQSAPFKLDFRMDFGYWVAWKFFPQMLRKNHFPEYYPDVATAYFDLVVLSTLQTWIGREGSPFYIGIETTTGRRSEVDVIRDDNGQPWSEQDKKVVESVVNELYQGERPPKVSTINFIPFSIV